jgi:UDP-N-acetylglucosamine--N-acetylmuramyl-(pentapeptide) pyrophosphoryl-undecaprenol N-acetylglucosamine transferase
MGTLNKVTSRFANEVFSSFDKKSMIKDYPVSSEFFDLGRIRDKVNTIAFFGGSQGAIAVNDFALKLAPRLNEMGINIIHQTGKNDFERIKKEYTKLNIDADVFDFSKDIPSKMAKADFAVSRAGASTLWELCANCLPTFFIPYKYAAGDHQYYNAKDLRDKGLCFLQREGKLKEEDFFNAINSDIHALSKNLTSSISSNAVSLICNIIVQNNKK